MKRNKNITAETITQENSLAPIQGSNPIITQESLQPRKIKKEEKAYQCVKDIETRLQKGDATNIALTGPYGSGKSSILLTLKDDIKGHQYLNISLATLDLFESSTTDKADETEEANKANDANKGAEDSKTITSEKTDKTKKDKDTKPEGKRALKGGLTKQNLDRLIEYCILQQLIYHEKQETLPNSRLKRIFHLRKEKIQHISLTTLLCLLCLIIVFEPAFLRVEWLCQLFGHEWLNILCDTLSLFYLAIYAYRALIMIIPALSNSSLNKLNLKSGEIEIVKNTSIFNKHLDEILYFFEQTEYDVVLLEDLDRFNTTDIFLKLRELNLLLNESKVIERKIFFIYAVRDDMFKDAERVKCFDYITTVIPVINRSNAKDLLKEELEKRGVSEIADVHLRELGFFLYDMRLLKNITNEYVQYRGKLSKGISSEKLLAMIVYKNYFPQDFADLHDCKGIVYRLFNLKESLISKRIEALEAEYKKKQEERAAYRIEKQLKEKELRRIYVEAYRDMLGSLTTALKVNEGMNSFERIANDENLFEKLISNPTVTYSHLVGQGYQQREQVLTTSIPFTEVEKHVDESRSYRERLELLRSDFASFEDDINIELRKEDIRALTLSQLMREIDYTAILSEKGIEIPKMIEYFVLNGYIDENYYDYISYFYGDFIDSHDWEFVLDLKRFKAHPYNFHINNAEACVEEIPNPVYNKNAILNIELIDYLAQNISNKLSRSRLAVSLRTAVKNSKYDFFAAYYQSGKQKKIVFEMLFDLHSDLWDAFIKYDDAEQSLKLLWFKYAEVTHSCAGSKEWLSANYSFITDNLLDISEEEWGSLIRNGDYEFEELNVISDDILKAVADVGAFTLTRHNIKTLVSSLLDMKVESVSYSLVFETGHKALINRVEKKLNECLQSVFSSPESESEDASVIIQILQSPRATEEAKISYLKKQKNKIELETIDNKDVLTLALKCDVVKPTWENVIYYLNNVSSQKADPILTTYIERHSKELAGMEVPRDSEDDERMLLREFIDTDTLSLSAYQDIIGLFKRWKYSNVSSIPEDRLLIMIDNLMISYTEDNTINLQRGYSDTVFAEYLLKNKKSFLKNKDTISYSPGVAYKLLKSNLTAKEKASVITSLDNDSLNEDVATEVIRLMNSVSIPVKKDFIIKAMSLAKITDEKISIINNYLENTTSNDHFITELINTLPLPYNLIAIKGKKPELPNTHQVRKLVKALENKHYISTYSETEKGIRVFTKLK